MTLIRATTPRTYTNAVAATCDALETEGFHAEAHELSRKPYTIVTGNDGLDRADVIVTIDDGLTTLCAVDVDDYELHHRLQRVVDRVAAV